MAWKNRFKFFVGSSGNDAYTYYPFQKIKHRKIDYRTNNQFKYLLAYRNQTGKDKVKTKLRYINRRHVKNGLSYFLKIKDESQDSNIVVCNVCNVNQLFEKTKLGLQCYPKTWRVLSRRMSWLVEPGLEQLEDWRLERGVRGCYHWHGTWSSAHFYKNEKTQERSQPNILRAISDNSRTHSLPKKYF